MTIKADPAGADRNTGGLDRERRETLQVAAMLIVIGAALLLGQILNVGWLILPVLAVIFYGSGLLMRSSGLLIPGGILGGIALGILVANPGAETASDSSGGLFLVAFAVGWASITVLTALFTDETHWWALVPGAVLAFIGVAVLLGGTALDLVALAGTYWPVLLIAGGLYMLYRLRATSP